MFSKRNIFIGVISVVTIGVIVVLLVSRQHSVVPKIDDPPADGVTILADDLGIVELGSQLQIDYFIPPGTPSLTSAVIEIRNNNSNGEALVYSESVSSTIGDHSITWNTQWNQGTTENGAYANPKNGPYSIKIVGTTSGGEQFESNQSTLNTLFVIETALTDDKPSSDEISSGIDPAALDLSGLDTSGLDLSELDPEVDDPPIQVGVAHGGSPATPEVFTWGSSPSFSNLVVEDLDNDPEDGNEIKSVQLRQEMPSTLSDGVYRVVIENFRDKAGNDGQSGVINDWIMRLY